MAARTKHALLALAVVLIVAAVQAAVYRPSEPFYNGDETRHVMTGVFFRDLYVDRPVTHLRDYAVRYYAQYPALALLVWPPCFYAVEGMFMLAFGTSFLTAKVLVGLFAALACVYLFRLVVRTHDAPTAGLAALLLGLAPLVFDFSRQVMLEVPTLACALVALYHFLAYLDRPRRRDLALCAVATACTALTRFDGVFLLPLFVILLLAKRRLAVLCRWEVVLTIALAVLAVAPFYGATAWAFGSAHLKAVREGTSADSTGFLAPVNFVFYPACVPAQVGWFALVPALVGLAAALTPARRPHSWPYLALVLATYLTFVPMAEIQSRHAIYWVPAFALFAADGVLIIGRRGLRLPSTMDSVRWTRYIPAAVAILVVAGTVWLDVRRPAPYVRGYEEAARYVVEHTEQSPTCLFDSFLNGNFIYQVRRHDPGRRLWVLRGDKVFYSVLSDPHAGYEERARGEADILALIARYDPELIVIETPQVYFRLPMPDAVRAVLQQHTERFRLETVIPLDSNYPSFRDVKLEVYRNLQRAEHPGGRIEIDVMGMQRTIEATLPGRTGP
jgi:hypothetical protein